MEGSLRGHALYAALGKSGIRLSDDVAACGYPSFLRVTPVPISEPSKLAGSSNTWVESPVLGSLSGVNRHLFILTRNTSHNKRSEDGYPASNCIPQFSLVLGHPSLMPREWGWQWGDTQRFQAERLLWALRPVFSRLRGF